MIKIITTILQVGSENIYATEQLDHDPKMFLIMAKYMIKYQSVGQILIWWSS